MIFCVSGIMTQQEYVQYESVKSVNLKYWVPLMWFSNLLSKVRQEGRIYDDMTFKHLMEVRHSYVGLMSVFVNAIEPFDLELRTDRQLGW